MTLCMGKDGTLKYKATGVLGVSRLNIVRYVRSKLDKKRHQNHASKSTKLHFILVERLIILYYLKPFVIS